MERRLEKINELLRQQLGIIILEEFGDMMGMVTVNMVEISPDLSSAKVYLGIIDNNCEKVIKKLTAQEPDLHWKLGKNLNFKTFPRLKFVVDKSSDDLLNMQKIIDKVKDE